MIFPPLSLLGFNINARVTHALGWLPFGQISSHPSHYLSLCLSISLCLCLSISLCLSLSDIKSAKNPSLSVLTGASEMP